jgi:hypothetical protein
VNTSPVVSLLLNSLVPKNRVLLRTATGLLFLIITLLLPPSLVQAEQTNSERNRIYAREADSETLWTGKFTHCDYGFYVLLPDKFVGHSNKPPNPIHGFLVGLPDPSTTNPVATVDERFIGVIADYDSYGLASLDKAADLIIESKRKKPNFKVLAQGNIQLNGQAAKRVKFQYSDSKDKFVEEWIIALRGGILYQIYLRTTLSNYDADRLPFTTIASNFRWWKVHTCP